MGAVKEYYKEEISMQDNIILSGIKSEQAIKKAYIKGIFMGVVICFLFIFLTGFSSGGLGTRFNPMYVTIVD